MKISILVPTYNGAFYITETILSIIHQNFKDYEIIISDDCSKDNTVEIIKSLHNPKIKIFQNKKNLGYPRNLESGRKHCFGEILYLMGQDDIMAKNTLKNIVNAFKISKDIGAVTRPYFWFDKDIKQPVRAKKKLSPKKDTIVKITDDPKKVILVFETLDQLSGLAYRKEFFNVPFHSDIFPCHIYPFADIFKNHPIVFLKDYTIAVRIASSQTRNLSSIYEKSPLLSWIQMVKSVFNQKKYQKIQKYLIKDFITKNYVGLVQLKNYAKYKYLFREIFYLIKFNWTNIFSVTFWFFSLGCIITPAKILIPLVDWYKNKVYSKILTDIKINYHL